MTDTIAFYNQNAEIFVSGTLHADMSENQSRFLRYVKPGGRILDAGCGSGRDTIAFLKAGFQADAFDASEEICRLASENTGILVACKRFEELSGEEEYDGIWACASLLHVKAENLPDVMMRLKRLLKPEGILYASFKEGSTERVKEGRFFHDMTAESLRELFEQTGLTVLESFFSRDVREGRNTEVWVNVIGKKPEKP